MYIYFKVVITIYSLYKNVLQNPCKPIMLSGYIGVGAPDVTLQGLSGSTGSQGTEVQMASFMFGLFSLQP